MTDRTFIWTRSYSGMCQPQIIYGERVGGQLNVLFARVLTPEEYGDNLATLAARYPAPVIVDEETPSEDHRGS